MTTEPKIETYLFSRSDGFYPIHIPKDSVAANIKANPGTLKVEAFISPGSFKVVWTLADGWLDRDHKAMQKEIIHDH